MTSWIRVGGASEVKPGEMKGFPLGEKTVAVANVAGKLSAFDDECTHAGCSLAGGTIEGGVVTCWCHGAQFSVKTGEVKAAPATKPLKIYKVRVQGDDLLVEA